MTATIRKYEIVFAVESVLNGVRTITMSDYSLKQAIAKLTNLYGKIELVKAKLI